MALDPTVLPGLLLLTLELAALAAVGFVVARVALRQTDDRLALAQGLVIGPALWGLIVNFVLHLLPGMAGALAGWLVVLALGVGLAWRTPHVLRFPIRPLAGFGLATTAIFWVALAGRQTLSIADPEVHLGLAAQIRAGGYPPAFPWSPDVFAAYHHGFHLLVGLLTPPSGPDMAFTTELLSAYAWTGLVLNVAALLLRGGWTSALGLSPLLLSAGLWTLITTAPPSGIVQIPVPTGLPTAGLRASLAGVYWPPAPGPWQSTLDATPANIWKPSFVLAYTLALLVLERASAKSGNPSWVFSPTLALLVGFLGLIDETVALVVLGVWGALEASRLFRRSAGLPSRARVPSVAGLALAGLLLVAGGGVITGVLTGSSGSGLSLGWIEDGWQRRPLGSMDPLSGGVGLLGLGVVPVVGMALLLDWRNRLVLGLAAASGASLLAALTLQYQYAQHDVVRFDGHARNFALLVLLVALARRSCMLRAGWRYAAAALAVLLVTWPTVAAPVRVLGQGLSRGPQFANAHPEQRAFEHWHFNRYVIPGLASDAVRDYISTHTATDAHILSPSPTAMSIATGRPSAAGLMEVLHPTFFAGPAYLDAIRFLEPAAFRRLNIEYVHTTDTWLTGLPDRARRWLASPEFFEPLIRDGGDMLYRVRPGFLRLDPAPAPASFEALRQAVPASATVYFGPNVQLRTAIRIAAALPHARRLGFERSLSFINVRATFWDEPRDSQIPDVVVSSAQVPPKLIASGDVAPVWWNDAAAVYAPGGAVAPLMAPPAAPRISLATSSVHSSSDFAAFTATFTNPTAEHWTSQDWVIVRSSASLWELLRDLEPGRGVPWFGGQIDPKPGVTSFTYQFDAREGRLSVRGADGTLASAPSSASPLRPGVWTLLMRLRDSHHKAHLFPLLQMTIAADGAVHYETAAVGPEAPLTQPS